MGVFEMVVCIVAIGVFGGVLGSYLKNKGRATTKSVLDRIDALETRVADNSIESRLQALETIVTDNKTVLKEKIDAL